MGRWIGWIGIGLWLGGRGGAQEPLLHPQERHLQNVRQLTFGGENAEGYFSPDGKRLVFQSRFGDLRADQIFVMNLDGSGRRMVSTGKGRCTCAFFLADGRHLLFSSTHHFDPEPPPPPERSLGYAWPVYPTYDIFLVRDDGTGLRQLTTAWGYDAEATVGPDGRIVFTSMREGDLDLWLMDADGVNLRRLTSRLGYEGGAFFSPDGKRICFRAFYPQTEEEILDYKRLLARHLVRPPRLELYVMEADGSHVQQVTHNGAMNFCPFFTPDGKRLIFASNMHNPRGRNFDLFLINLDGTGLEQVTFHPDFDAFPMFSPDGKRLVWASNRQGKEPGETNLFLADWVE